MEPVKAPFLLSGLGVKTRVEYISTDTIPYFKDCQTVLEPLGIILVELHVTPLKGCVNVSAIVCLKDSSRDISVSDCSKAHRAILPVLAAKTGRSEDDLSMEVSSPGLSHNIKNAVEFSFFVGREIRVWTKSLGDWENGIIESTDEKELVLKKNDGSSRTVEYGDIAKAKFIHL